MSAHSTSPSSSHAAHDQEPMVVCPGCHKSTSPRFTWHFDDESFLCLVCYHKMPEKAQKRHQSALKGDGRVRGYVFKAVSLLLLTAGLLVGAVCVFYKPHANPTTASATGAANPHKHKPTKKGGSSAGGGAAEGSSDSDDANGDEKAKTGRCRFGGRKRKSWRQDHAARWREGRAAHGAHGPSRSGECKSEPGGGAE